MEEEKEVPNSIVGPKHEISYRSKIFFLDVRETQQRKNNNLRINPPIFLYVLRFSGLGIPEGDWEIYKYRIHEVEIHIKKEYLECITTTLRMEDYVWKENNVGGNQSGSGNKERCLKENSTINTQHEIDSKETIKHVVLKVTKNLHTPKNVHK